MSTEETTPEWRRLPDQQPSATDNRRRIEVLVYGSVDQAPDDAVVTGRLFRHKFRDDPGAWQVRWDDGEQDEFLDGYVAWRPLPSLTLATARKLFRYDPLTGILYRQHARGEKVGSATSNGYLVVSVHGKQYQVHRLVWFITYGKWPIGNIDHLNRIKTDNRLSNLRDVTQQVNAMNSSTADRVFGPMSSPDGWIVRLPCFDEIRELGPFATHGDAHAAFSRNAEFAFWSEGRRWPELLTDLCRPNWADLTRRN